MNGSPSVTPASPAKVCTTDDGRIHIFVGAQWTWLSPDEARDLRHQLASAIADVESAAGSAG